MAPRYVQLPVHHICACCVHTRGLRRSYYRPAQSKLACRCKAGVRGRLKRLVEG